MRTKGSVIVTDELADDVLLRCEGVGICYRKPYKLGQSHDRENREFWPFQDLDLELKRGETLGVLGPNGAGKSTLLRLLAGVTHPDAGRLMKRPNLNIQLLSVNLGFERILTGRENAVMAGMLLGKSRNSMEDCLEAIKEYSELADFFEEPVYSYSSGMVARLGFSIAIEADPDVLLLDEVMSVGDQAFRDKSRARTEELIKSGKSVVLVSHDLSMHSNLSNRMVNL
jgi:lipopolysaccharide transport system ATP-binding protein